MMVSLGQYFDDCSYVVALWNLTSCVSSGIELCRAFSFQVEMHVCDPL